MESKIDPWTDYEAFELETVRLSTCPYSERDKEWTKMMNERLSAADCVKAVHKRLRELATRKL